MSGHVTYREGKMTFAILTLYVGLAFFLLGSFGWTAMSPRDYGTLATSFEIESMAALQMCAALMVMAGVSLDGRWPMAAAFRLAGALVVALLCGGLAVSATQAPDGWPFSVYLIGYACWSLFVAWKCLVDLRALPQREGDHGNPG